MKTSILFLFLLSISFNGISQTLFTFGQNIVTKQEFETAYNKNKTATTDDQKALQEYLDLYIAFKLKVQAAKDLQMDTLPGLKADLENFKNQIDEIYLKDERMVNKLNDEAFERSQKDIHLIDYFISVPQDADTAIYFTAINNLHKNLKNNQKRIKTPNEANIQETRSDVGYITAFTLPYEFENVIYNLQPGTYSDPVRTEDGWHIFENAGERPAVGQIRVAQILISAPENSEKERNEAKKLADSLYKMLQNGADFSGLAREFSHDRATYFNDGILPAFGVGKYTKDFEDHAFSLKKDGEISFPFETEFGYHILKRISAEPVPATKEKGLYLEELYQKVAKDGRMKAATDAFNMRVIKMTGTRETRFDKNSLWLITDSSLLANRMVTSASLNEESPLLEFNDESVATVRDWTLYLRNTVASLMGGNLKSQYPALFSEFKQFAAFNNYKKRLAEFSPEFKAQIEEFRDGNMLFEVMEKEVWNKAATDSIGLQDFYQKNKHKYIWNESADALIVSTMNETIAQKVIADLKNKKNVETILEENESLVHIDSSRYELQQLPLQKEETLTVYKITQPVLNEQDGTVTFVQILRLYPPNDQRSFEEARGMVISDYQTVLEEKWLTTLKQKYPVKVNKKTFKKLLK